MEAGELVVVLEVVVLEKTANVDQLHTCSQQLNNRADHADKPVSELHDSTSTKGEECG